MATPSHSVLTAQQEKKEWTKIEKVRYSLPVVGLVVNTDIKIKLNALSNKNLRRFFLTFYNMLLYATL
jgi:hypothetical protein